MRLASHVLAMMVHGGHRIAPDKKRKNPISYSVYLHMHIVLYKTKTILK